MARIDNGWLVVLYDGPDLADVVFKIGDSEFPAYLNYLQGKRVAQIRPPSVAKPGQMVQVLVNGTVYKQEKIP